MRRLILTTSVLLSSCSLLANPPQPDWVRADASPDQTAADLSACQRAAQNRVNIDQQLNQAMGADPTGQGGLINNLNQYNAERQFNRYTRDCMTAQGYSPASSSSSSTKTP
jgi:hypothetical protein